MLLALVACEGARSVVRDAPGDTLMAINGTRLWVHVEAGRDGEASGGGTPMFVLHGGPLLDHGYLVDPLRPLTDVAPLVFHDQRLSGRSDGVGEPGGDGRDVSLDLLVDDIDVLRAELGLDRIRLLGHSWGAGLAVRYAIAHPDRTESLVLVSPPAPSFDLAEREGRAQGESVQPADTAGLGEIRASPGMATRDPGTIERMLRVSFRGQFVDRALAERLEFEIPADYATRSTAMGAVGRDLAGYDLTAQLRDLRVPTLVVYGAAEAGALLSGPAWQALLPDGRVTVIDGAKHFAFMERPDEFQRVVRAFLEEY
jgi:proline iminopeptidase